MNSIFKRILLLPIFGILLFAVMYIIAASLYPGGSQTDIHSTGFSWRDNYWCNLFNRTAINGEPNPARPIARIAMYILAASLQFFWMLIAFLTAKSKPLRTVVIISSVSCTVFISSLAVSDLHDLLVNLASLAGLIVTICTMFVLYKLKWNSLFFYGLMNILLVVINNYVYYSKELIIWLPIIQKITFLFFLLWICCITWQINHQRAKAFID